MQRGSTQKAPQENQPHSVSAVADANRHFSHTLFVHIPRRTGTPPPRRIFVQQQMFLCDSKCFCLFSHGGQLHAGSETTKETIFEKPACMNLLIITSGTIMNAETMCTVILLHYGLSTAQVMVLRYPCWKQATTNSPRQHLLKISDQNPTERIQH